MSAVLSNPKLSLSDKVTMYNQSLAKFLTYYNPVTYGDSPQLTTIAKSIGDVADKKSITGLTDKMTVAAKQIATASDSSGLKNEFSELKSHIIQFMNNLQRTGSDQDYESMHASTVDGSANKSANETIDESLDTAAATSSTSASSHSRSDINETRPTPATRAPKVRNNKFTFTPTPRVRVNQPRSKRQPSPDHNNDTTMSYAPELDDYHRFKQPKIPVAHSSPKLRNNKRRREVEILDPNNTHIKSSRKRKMGKNGGNLWITGKYFNNVSS